MAAGSSINSAFQTRNPSKLLGLSHKSVAKTLSGVNETN